ncbi:peroxidasin-like protein [Pecten maximus]|uniref:peroxidasin-like protein n=1 Tax=Pecten maximus TaxID=6579 RepID=UPI00145828C3|nr:peroxidasin-like protein [Pecten maximus]
MWINKKTSTPYSIGRMIFTGDERFGFTSSSSIVDWSVLLRDVKQSDQGIFTCLANTKPKKIRDIHLTVLSPPKITNSSAETTSVIAGDTVELMCMGEGSPPPTVSWYEDSLTGRNMVGTSARLLIHNISGISGGHYRGYREYHCSLDNGHPLVVSRKFRVDVQSAPNLQLVTPSDRIVPAGNDVMMAIRCTGNPSPMVEWIHNGYAIEQGNKRYKVDSQEDYINSLTITGVNEDEFGFYRVQCENMFGHTGAVFQIKQLVPPDIDLTRSSGNQTVYLGASLNVSCYSSSETAMFNWYKSGDQGISQSPVGSGNTLSFQSVKASDAGTYVCMTGNIVGYTTHHITITIRELIFPRIPKSRLIKTISRYLSNGPSF